ncbi:hypothetical protein VI817_010417 [Penicillium citrinum]|uniref:Uncharacterized protein n=1 Tax=Penicillium hetheringtonii TaxID=911720 RepID=A0AAD6GQN2_9EURO|nr:hypothetical protein N7450_008190 [Penicillium hetheringtonii]KAK5787921.1 hypothetical protein VI817_010417 [Penicillium citrinum]
MPESETNKYLKLYIGAMNCLQAQYEGAERVLGHIKVIVGQLHFQSSSQRTAIDNSNAVPTLRSEYSHETQLARKREKWIDLSDIAMLQPKKYLLITYYIDSCLSRGRLPDETALQATKTTIYLSPLSFECQKSRKMPDDLALYDLALQLGLTGSNSDYDLDDAADGSLDDANLACIASPGLGNW